MPNTKLQNDTNFQLNDKVSNDQIDSDLNVKLVETEKLGELAANKNISVAENNLNKLKLTRKSKFTLKKRLIIGIISIFSILSLVGGGMFVYFNYFPSPEIVLARSFENIKKSTAVEFSGDILFKTRISTITPLSDYERSVLSRELSLSNMRIRLDNIDSDKISGEGDLNLYYKDSTFTDLLNTKVEGKLSENKIYAKFDNLTESYPNVKNKWVKFNEAEAIKDSIKDLKNQNNLTIDQAKFKNEQKQKLENQLLKVAKITKVYKDDKINNIDLYHYQLSVDLKELSNYLSLVKEYKGTKANTDNQAQSKINNDPTSNYKDSSQIIEQKNSDDILKDLKPINTEIWIKKNNFELYKINSSFDFSSNIENLISYDLKLQFENFNKPLKIETPEKTYTLEEVLKLYSPENLNADNPIITSIDKDSDNDGLYDNDETNYGTDPNNPDSDGDGYLDGDEVKNDYDPNGDGKLIPNLCGIDSCPIIKQKSKN